MMSKEDILAKCIDDIEAGKATVEECMANYPELRDELQPLLEIAQRLQTPHVAPSAEFKQRAKSRLLEEMRGSSRPARQHSGAASPGWLKVLMVVRRPGFAVTAILIVLLLAAGGGGAVYASQDSLPDDALYPVKKAVEKVQFSLARSPEARAGLRATLAQRRVEEIIAQASLGRSISDRAVQAIPANINAAIIDISSTPSEQARPLLTKLAQSTLNQEIRLSQVMTEMPDWSHAKLERAFDSVQRGNLIARVAYDNPAFLSSRPSVEDDQLEAAYFEVKGTLLSADDGNWNVGGVAISGVKLDSVPERPVVGSRVQVKGVVQKDGTFISKIDSQEDEDDLVQVQGVLGSTSPDDKVWYVGGVPVAKPYDATPPPVGSSMKVAGTVDKDNLVVTSVKREDDEDEGENRVNVKGILAGVNAGQNSIAIDVAGSKVTVNTSKASIESGDGKALTLADLASLVGKDVKVSRPYVAGGILHAQKVRVDVGQVTKPVDRGQQPGGGDDKQGSNASPTTTPRPTPTSAPTPTERPTPTPKHTEGSGEDKEEGDLKPTSAPTPTERPTPTPKYTKGSDEDKEGGDLKATPTPTPTKRPTPTPKYTEGSKGDKEGGDLKVTPTKLPTPTPTYTEGSKGDKEGGDLKVTPMPTAVPHLIPTPTPTPRYTERTGDDSHEEQTRPTPTPTPRYRDRD